MFKAVNNLKEQKGFTLIELLIVVAIIGILAAVGIPGYIGMQERGRKGAVTRTCESNTSELQAFMISAKKAGTPQNILTEVDTDGDGVVTVGQDDDNQTLATNGPLATFIARHAPGANMPLSSPWNGSQPLFIQGANSATLAACQAAAVANQVTLCASPTDDAGIRRIFIIARDIDNNEIYSKTVTAD